MDVIVLTTIPQETPEVKIPYNAHSLGRMVAAAHPDGNGYMVVDGQQRLTTVCVLLSTIRDYFLRQQKNGEPSVPVVHLIQSLLFPKGLESECVLRPTYFDRKAFNFCVMLETLTTTTTTTTSSPLAVDHVSETRAYFESMLPRLWSRIGSKLGLNMKGTQECESGAVEAVCALSLVQACIDKCTMLFFLMNEKGDEILAAYSRLAMRDAMLSFQLNNSSPGVKLQFVDLCRNLVCCQFPGSEEEKIAGYHLYWAPIEAMAMERAVVVSSIDGNDMHQNKYQNAAADNADAMVVELDQLLKAFVQSKRSTRSTSTLDVGEVMGPPPAATRKPVVPAWTDPGQYQFPIYTKLQATLANAVKNGQPVEDFLATLLVFAKTIWNTNSFESFESSAEKSEVNGGGGSNVEACMCLARHGTLCVGCIVAKNGQPSQPLTNGIRCKKKYR